MVKKIIVIAALAFTIFAPYVTAMQQQQVQQQQKQKPVLHQEDEPQDDILPDVQNATDTKTQVHECVFGPEHPYCGLCGCDGISEYGKCVRDNGPHCHGRHHVLTCTICGAKKSTQKA